VTKIVKGKGLLAIQPELGYPKHSRLEVSELISYTNDLDDNLLGDGKEVRSIVVLGFF